MQNLLDLFITVVRSGGGAYIAAVFAVLLLFITAVFFTGLAFGRIRSEQKFKHRLTNERRDAVKRSRAVLEGQFSEQLAPFLPNFPLNPTEVCFLGKPIDFIGFRERSAGTISEVIFIEVKSGASQLSQTERSLRDCIKAGRVRYIEYRIDTGKAVFQT